jgi:hypothetical protein
VSVVPSESQRNIVVAAMSTAGAFGGLDKAKTNEIPGLMRRRSNGIARRSDATLRTVVKSASFPFFRYFYSDIPCAVLRSLDNRQQRSAVDKNSDQAALRGRGKRCGVFFYPW